jgi:hypothetical protein
MSHRHAEHLPVHTVLHLRPTPRTLQYDCIELKFMNNKYYYSSCTSRPKRYSITGEIAEEGRKLCQMEDSHPL